MINIELNYWAEEKITSHWKRRPGASVRGAGRSSFWLH